MTSNPVGEKVGLGARVAQWLRQHYPVSTRKSVAASFGVSPGMAKLWLLGRAPASWHLEDMAARWGQGFIVHAFQDACHKAEEWRIRRRADAIDKQIERARDELAVRQDPGRGRVAGIGRALASASRATLRGVAGKLSLRRRQEAA